jgi:hypothetical protein
VLVTAGMACAGLPAAALVTGRWADSVLSRALTSLPWCPLLITIGFAGIASGVYQAMHAVCGDVENDLGLPGAAFSWSDYYASADPVSNGPLAPGTPVPEDPPTGGKPPLVPSPCNEVYNSGSVAFDHNGYLRNQDELLPSLLNDLVAAAYGDGASTASRPELVRHKDVTTAGQRRRRLVRCLVAARIAAVALLPALLWVNPGRALKHPVSQLMHRFAAPAAMGNGTARLLAALLLTAAFYLTAITAWRAAIRRSERSFFRDANSPAASRQPDSVVPHSQAATSEFRAHPTVTTYRRTGSG